MELLIGIIFWIVLVTGIVLTLFGIPGTFIIASAALLYSLFTDFSGISWVLIFLLFAIAILLEFLEFSLSGYMANRFGGSKLSIVGAILGGLIGAIWGTAILPVIGTLIGAFIGAFGGAFIGEYFISRDLERALLAGIGAFLGAVGGKTMKTVTAVAMVVTIGFYFF
ncbi:MAG: DUF456 domain-containing protein [Candidatus Marinimicrobia bacterium]|nr:DUF456 domain-containing protein [Candidatus Neomarinimicrobiota bacterium]